MADQKADDKFVEVDGSKFKEDPENEGQPLKDDEDNPIPFEEVKEEDKEEDDDPVIADPTPRRSAATHIIERQKEKIKKLEEKPEEDEAAREVTTSGQKAIDESVKRQLDPLNTRLRQTSDEQELREILSNKESFPFAKKLEAGIRKYMAHPQYEGVSVEFIYAGLVTKSGLIQKEAAKQKADDETEEMNLGGSNTRRPKDEKLPDFSKMSAAEFDEYERKNR